MASKYHGIHKQQLFHWLAAKSHREAEMETPLTPKIRQDYLKCLAGSLENGLWVKTPRKPEVVKQGKFEQALNIPIACFTEWSLNDSLKHTREYGQMAFGFSKTWLIKHGGQPITYYHHSAGGSFLKTLITLLKNAPANPKTRDALLYLIHFTKRLRKPMPTEVTGTAAGKKVAKKRRRAVTRPAPPDPFARFWSSTMPYLEEREWRVVAHPNLVNNGLLVPNPKKDGPKYYLPYQSGKDLFTLVLPDNQTVSQVLQKTWFTDRLFPKNAPHVTVLSLQDIGTF